MKRSIQQLIRPNITKLNGYSSAREEYGSSYGDFLDANEFPDSGGYARYPDPYQQTLKAKISEINQVPAENILIGNGSDEVLDLLFRAFCEPGKDNVIVNVPTYGMYDVLACINDVAVKEVPLTPQFDLDVEGIVRQVDTRTKMVFVCSPNNPTGNLMSLEAIKKLLDQNVLVIVDEAYIQFNDALSLVKLIDSYENLLVCQTLSKIYGLADLRVGLLFGNVAIVQLLNKIKPPYNVSGIAQRTVVNRLDKIDVERRKSQIIELREWLREELLNLKQVETIYPSDANFLLVKFQDAHSVYKYLVSQGIIVRNRSKQPGCANCLRVTIGTEKQMSRLVETIKNMEYEESVIY